MVKLFMPKRVYFEPDALEYPLGAELYKRFKATSGVTIYTTNSHNRITGIPGKTPREAYVSAKETLVIGIKKEMKFESCKPSAHYQFPLATSCPGHCEYCYLQTTLGKKPYVRIYVNVDEILTSVVKHMEERLPEITHFEGASSSDPLAVEHISGSLAKTIEFFGDLSHGRFRFVTKFDNVDSLLDLKHNNHTRFRFSVNSDYVIRSFEHGTPVLQERVNAAGKVAKAGYHMGFIIAPIMRFEGWQEQYKTLFKELKNSIGDQRDLTFELIMHRFTKAAKKVIYERFPNTKLEMDEKSRKYKYGKYGMGKWVYKDEEAEELKNTIEAYINECFPASKLEYFT